MGSFSEIVMSFRLRPDLPAEVMGAFSRMPVAKPTDGAKAGSPAPELPPPHEDEIDDEDLSDAYEEEGFAEDFEPWAYDWSGLLSEGSWTAYLDALKSATLAWTGHTWLVTFRTTAKADPEELAVWLAWMGQFAGQHEADDPFLVGYIKHEEEPRPWLVWHKGDGEFDFEDLNEPGDRD